MDEYRGLFNDIPDEIYYHFAKLISKNDAAHQMDHIANVAKLALKIADAEGVKGRLIFKLAALGHDCMCWRNRETHALEGASYTSGFLAGRGYSIDVCALIACMIGQHRASFKGTYQNKHSEIFACADRGAPDSKAMIQRSFAYAKSMEYTDEQALIHATEHMREKFSNVGYAKYPQIYLKYFAEELAVQRAYFDTLTVAETAEVMRGVI